MIVIVYPILWGLYLIWDLLKSKEHKDNSLNVFWSFPYLLVFAVIAFSYLGIISVYQSTLLLMKWVGLAGLFATILVYRIKQPTP